jgi:hypothetical protein
MPSYFRLDKIITQGTVYQMPPDRAYVIQAIGTDATSPAKLVIDGVPTTPIINEIAPMYTTGTNLLGPLDLKDLYIVIPPDRKFWVDGPSGCKMRIMGNVVFLGPGEPIPTNITARYGTQGDIYYTYVTGTYDHGTNTTWNDTIERTLFTLTPSAIETYTFNSYLGVKLLSDTISPGQFGLRFYYDDRIIDMLTRDAGPRGIDIYSIRHPPSTTTDMYYLSFDDAPIVVQPNHTLKLTVINDSGSNLTPSTGKSFAFQLFAIVVYKRS